MKARLFLPGLVSLLLLLPAVALGQFAQITHVQIWDTIYSGARSQSLGDSDLATLQAPTSVFENPALLLPKEGISVGYDNYDYVFDIEFRHYGIGYRTGALTVLAAMKEMTSSVRTAYDPVETTATNRVYALGVNYDLNPRVLKLRHVRWTVGLAYRHNTAEIGDDSYGTGDLDFGTAFRYTPAIERGLLELSAAASAMNVLGNSYGEPDAETNLNQLFRYGFGVKFGVPVGRFDRDGLTVSSTMTWINPQNDPRGDSSFNYGVECVIYHLVALRTGYNEDLFNGMTGRGVGLILDEHLPGPVSVRVDYSKIVPGPGMSFFIDEGHDETWSVNAAWEF